MGQKIIDPETGLELEVLTPAPPMWSGDSVYGRMTGNPNHLNVAEGANPFTHALNQSVSAVPDPVTASEPMVVASPEIANQLAPSSFMDKVMHTVFGTPDSKLSPEEEAQTHGKRDDAARFATSAANDPGAAHMGIPTASGGSSFGEILQFLPKLIQGLSGLV